MAVELTQVVGTGVLGKTGRYQSRPFYLSIGETEHHMTCGDAFAIATSILTTLGEHGKRDRDELMTHTRQVLVEADRLAGSHFGPFV